MARRLLLTALLTSLALAGCAPATPEQAGTTADLVLQERLIVMYMSPVASYAELPIISVYGDGRVITTAPYPDIYPGPALARLQVQKILSSDVRRLRDLAVKAGVGSGADLGSPQVTDAASTRFTVRTDSGLVDTTAYAFGDEAEAQLAPAQQAARAALRDLDRSLRDLDATLGSVPAPAAYDPAGIAVIAQDWVAPNDSMVPAPPPIAWPGPPLPGHYLSQGLTCVAASGAIADAVFAAAGRANVNTPWTYGGKRWALTLRPLLPDESSCSDLSR